MKQRLAAILVADMFGFSQLIEADEEGTLSRQKAHRKELIDPEIERNRGRIIKNTGDGMLVEFNSVTDAVGCAIGIQRGMVDRERDSPSDSRIMYRVGINVGDVVFDEGDAFGDCVNVAARLESLAEPGGLCVSDPVYQLVRDRVDQSFRDIGSQRVKNISRPVQVWQWTPEPSRLAPELSEAARSQTVKFCTTSDGVRIAYAVVGSGPPLLKAPNWLNHLEYDWQSPVWGPTLNILADGNTLVRFDQRGNGLSDWDVDTISLDAMNSDMEVVSNAAGLEKFALFGISQGCGFSIRYAAEHSDRISCIVLLGGYMRGGLKRNSAKREQMQTEIEMMVARGWGSPNPAYRHFFTSNFMPDATPEQQKSFDELQRISTAPENAIRILEMNAEMDVTDLAKRIKVPTLVLHCQGDRDVPLEEGRRMAASIPNARFVTLEGNNHVLMEGSPAFESFFEEVNPFLREHNQ